MSFQPTTTGDLGEVAVVIRLPRSSEARILDLRAVGDADYSNVAHRVAANGLFAVYQAHPTGLRALDFELEVSGPAKATVRATHGLPPFEMEIRPEGAFVNEI
jgi:hypothetical protein